MALSDVSVLAEELCGSVRCVGTLAFIAPEAYKSGIYGQASEIYSLGIVIYSLMNNAKLPFFKEDINNAINLRLNTIEPPQPCNRSSDVWSYIRKLCAHDAKERCSTYEEAKAVLTDLINK